MPFSAARSLAFLLFSCLVASCSKYSGGRIVDVTPLTMQQVSIVKAYCYGGGAAGFSEDKYFAVGIENPIHMDLPDADALLLCQGLYESEFETLLETRHSCADSKVAAENVITLNVCAEPFRNRTVSFRNVEFNIISQCSKNENLKLTSYLAPATACRNKLAKLR